VGGGVGRRCADLAREGGRRRGCPSSMAGAELDDARARGRATEEQRMGAAKELRNGEEWREEGEIGVGRVTGGRRVGTGGDKKNCDVWVRFG
jgi:hypothetical protein